MYDPTRVRYPLKRVGPRGSGKWKRLSWDEANREIADAILDTLARDGSDRVVWDLGPLYTEGTMAAGHQCLSVLLDSTNLDMNTEIGDGHRGVGETFGKIAFERSADDYFYSDLILIWGSNPIYTQIPNAHFLTEARYRGAQVVCIAPDYSASSIHADLFVPVKPGCDAALGLGVAHVLVEEGLVDEDFVVEQTDLALLVREDTRLFLRSSDLEQGGSEEELYLHDAARGVVKAPRRSLGLGDLTPDLEGRFEVTLRDGGMVGVRTVFSLLREKLADYDPERASKLCGTPPSLIRQLAERLARAEAASMVTSANMCKFYHGNLIERTQALVFALTGNYGKKGSGFVGFPWLDHDGLEVFIRGMFSLKDMMHSTALKIIGKTIADNVRWRLAGHSDEMILHETGRDIIASGRLTSGALFWYVHGGLLEASQRLQEWDPYLKRPVREVLEESFEKGWQSVWPRPGNDPRVLFCLGSNPLRGRRSQGALLPGQQSAAPDPLLPAAPRAPLAQASHGGDARLAHDQHSAPVGLRAAGRRLVRAQRAQVGDAADALHTRRGKGHHLLRSALGLGDLLEARRGPRRAGERAGHAELHRPAGRRASPPQPVREVLPRRRLRPHRQ
jgi:anaerobic selenocysteine-containing dehydrogenase